MPDVAELQHQYIRRAIEWALRIRRHLADTQKQYRGQVHFRPSSGGVAMIGLLPERPQRGKGGYKNLARLAEHFEDEFDRHCCNTEQGRPTPEKRLQSFLIGEAYANGGLMESINRATSGTESPAELRFATDELAVPNGNRNKVVCDILAINRVGAGRFRPVVMELKSARQLKRLLTQVNAYAAVVQAHVELFAELFSVVLDQDVQLERECEKWIVWPALPSGVEPRETELAEEGVRIVSYSESENGFALRAFRSP